MRSTSNWITLKQRTVCIFIVPNFDKLCWALFRLLSFKEIFHRIWIEHTPNTLLMGEAHHRSIDYFLLKINIPRNSRIIAFLHDFLHTLFMKFGSFLSLLGEYHNPRRQSVQTMQNVQIPISHFIMQNSHHRVIVLATSIMNDHTVWLANNKKILIFVNNLDGQI